MKSAALLRLLPLLLATAVGAQETWIRAPRIDDVWTGRDGRLRAQIGRRVFVYDVPAEPGAPPRLAETAEIPAGTSVFDHEAAFATVAGAAAVPLRAPLWLAEGLSAHPSADRVELRGAEETGLTGTLRVAVVRRETWGLAGETVLERSAPHVFALGRGPRAPLLVGRSDAYVVRGEDGVVRPVAAAGIDEASGVQGFEIVVPPFLGDFDGDGAPEFVRVDPGRGTLALQGGLLEASPPPPRPTRFGGPCVAALAADAVGDATQDLCALKLPTLTPARQLAVLVEGGVTAQALVYAGGKDGLGASPTFSVDVRLGIAVSVRDGDRRARVTTLFAPWRDGRLLVVEPGGAAKAVLWERPSDVRELGAVSAGEFVRPLRPARVRGRVCAVLRTADGDRLLAF